MKEQRMNDRLALNRGVITAAVAWDYTTGSKQMAENANKQLGDCVGQQLK